MLIASAGFSLMLLSVKFISKEMPASEIVFFRSIFTLIVTFFMLRYRKVTPIFGRKRSILVLRGVFGVTALTLFYLTIQHIPLASAITVQYTSPIFTIIFGIFILKEKVKPLQWVFFAISFLGIFLIKGYDSEVPVMYLLFGLLSAIFAGLAYNCIRLVKDTDHPLVVVFYFPLIALPVMGVISYFNWFVPTPSDWFWLLLVGIFTQIGQVFMTMSYHHGSVAQVSGIRYFGIIYALAYGFFIFNESYAWMSLVGMLLVISGVLMNFILKDSN